jgi:glycosyltransferase involved in cell wall biosynthesis
MEPLLRSIKEQTYKNVEIIVVDNCSTDNTLEIARRFTTKIFTQGPERSAQRNRGAKESTGELLIVLDSDMQLTSRVIEHIVDVFYANPNIKAVVIPEESFGDGFWAKCKKLERSFYVGVAWMEAARAFRRDVFFEMSGYDEANTGTEDYDLPHRVEEKYGASSIGRINEAILHNEGHLSLVRSCRKKFYYARKLDIYVNKNSNKKKFALQSNPVRRYLLYFKNPWRLFRNPVHGIGMIFMKSCEMTSGVAGYLLRQKGSNVAKSIYK